MAGELGGKIRGVGLDSFMQIIQMDQMTCTLKVTSADGSGMLYFVGGELFSAVTGDLHNLEAACNIISWEGAVIEIEDACDKTENEIRQPLMNILMESMRLRDEAKVNAPKNLDQKQETNQLETAKPAPPQPDPAPLTVTKKNEGARLHRSRTATRGKPLLATIAGSFLVLLIGAGIMMFFYLKAERQKSDYEKVLDKVERTIPLQKKIDILTDYIQNSTHAKFAEDARQRQNVLLEKMMQIDFSAMESQAAALIQTGDLETALALYEQTDKKYPSSRLSGQIDQKKRDLLALIDSKAYEILMRRTETMGPEKVPLLAEFLITHPDSPHRAEIERLIAAMSQEYYAYTERRILDHEQRKDWDTCLLLSQHYIDMYPYSENIVVLREYQTICREKIEAAKTLADLKKQAASMADDYERIINLYADYLRATPHTRARDDIEQEIAGYHALSENRRVAAEITKIKVLFENLGTRFKVHDNGTVSDAKTGLMWCLIDSTIQLNRCLDYQEAISFVDSLGTGGYKDWRLPETEELKTLYREKPVFPSTGSTWYWTNKTHKRFVGRWTLEVDVVNTAADGSIESKESRHCGAVRAVRGGR